MVFQFSSGLRASFICSWHGRLDVKKSNTWALDIVDLRGTCKWYVIWTHGRSRSVLISVPWCILISWKLSWMHSSDLTTKKGIYSLLVTINDGPYLTIMFLCTSVCFECSIIEDCQVLCGTKKSVEYSEANTVSAMWLQSQSDKKARRDWKWAISLHWIIQEAKEWVMKQSCPRVRGKDYSLFLMWQTSWKLLMCVSVLLTWSF